LRRRARERAWQDKVELNVINDFNNQKACGTVNARVALSPAPTIAWQIPGAHCTAEVEGTYRWNPPR